MPEQVDGPSDGATAEGSSDAAAGTAACSPKLPAQRPTVPTPELPEQIFAVQYVASSPISDAGTGDALAADPSRLCASPAIDLDGIATCERLDDGGVAGPSCKGRKGIACDIQGGGDNTGGPAATYILGGSPSAGSDPNQAFAEGRGGILIDLVNYNGQDDDAEIAVSFIFAFGVVDENGAVGAKPKWDGTDRWLPEHGSFITDDQPTYVALEAYVSGGVLVARFGKTPFSFGGATTTRLEAQELIVTGRLVRPPGGGEATAFDQGRLAVRISTDTIFNYLGGRLANGISFCDPGPARAAAVTAVCNAADLPRDPASTDPARTCDAVSYAVGFYGVRAKRTEKPSKDLADATPPQACDASDWPPSCNDF